MSQNVRTVFGIRPLRNSEIGVIFLVLIGAAASVLIAAYWWAFVLCGAALTAASFFMPKVVPEVKPEIQVKKGATRTVTTSQFLIPQNWDPDEIGIQVRRLHGNASAARVFVDSIIKRFVLGQDSQTAKVRIEFLRSKLEEITLSKKLPTIAVSSSNNSKISF